MILNTKIIKLDINKKLYETISAKQGDTESRFLLFHIFDSSLPFDLTGKSVRVYGIKPDDKKIFNDLAINDAKKGYCTLELTNQMLSVAGLVKLELVIYNGNKKLSSIPFVLNVISSLNSEDAVVSTNEFTALMNGLAALSEYDTYKSNAKQVPVIKEEVSNLSAQLDNIETQRVNVNNLGLYASFSEDVTNKLQEIINNNTKLYFPNGRYIISKPIMLKSNIDILCDNGVEFFLKDMSKCIMFDTKASTLYENITINGGLYNGNDYGQGEQSSEGLFNFSNAFRFYNVKNLNVTNIKLKDIRGHAIQHWNCNGVLFENIIFDQNVDMDTKPNGGSRRDGITGGSSNVTYRNLRGFTDDDMIAILSGVKWGGVQVKDVENIIIDNVVLEDKYIDENNTHNTWCGIRIACCNNYTTRNVKVSNVSGKSAHWIIRLGGYDTYRDGFLENIALENINHHGGYNEGVYNEMGSFLVEQCVCKNLTLNNIFVNSKNNVKGTLLFNKNAKIEKLFLNNISYHHENTGSDCTESPLIKDYWNNTGYSDVYIDNILFNNLTYESNQNIMTLYKKMKTHNETITNITHLEGSGIVAKMCSNMLSGEIGKMSVNSKDIIVGDYELKNQKKGYVYSITDNIVTSISDNVLDYKVKKATLVTSYYSFTPKDSVILLTAQPDRLFRIQENKNYKFPIGFMIDIKRMDNDSSNMIPYLLMSDEGDLVGNTTSNKKQIYIKPKQRITLVHLGDYQWGLVGSYFDEF